MALQKQKGKSVYALMCLPCPAKKIIRLKYIITCLAFSFTCLEPHASTLLQLIFFGASQLLYASADVHKWQHPGAGEVPVKHTDPDPTCAFGKAVELSEVENVKITGSGRFPLHFSLDC